MVMIREQKWKILIKENRQEKASQSRKTINIKYIVIFQTKPQVQQYQAFFQFIPDPTSRADLFLSNLIDRHAF